MNPITVAKTIFEIQDAEGRHVANHVREDKPEGGKRYIWQQPDGTPGLNDTKLADMPLYGAEMVSDLGPDELIALVEGEQARDAAEAAGIPAVGTVTGAGQTPGKKALEVLRDRRVATWPDNDDPGRKHMERIAEQLDGVAAEVLMYTWHDAPEKGDAADHPAIKSKDPKAVDRLLNDLLCAPRWKPQKPEGLPDRVMLGELLEGGIEPTPQLIEGLLYEGRIHSMAGQPGTGKTIVALWASVQVMRQGRPVLYLDAENGPKLIAERLRDMGAEPEDLDEHFFYYPAEFGLDKEGLSGLMATITGVEPALVVLDSFADLLSIAGLEENSNDDCTKWMRTVAQPIKEAGSAVLILDHVPKGGKGPRGGGSKKAKVDVQWNLEVTQHFDRERTGEIELKHDKDRECWLPKIVRFSVGGGVFARSAGTIEDRDPQTSMTDSASKAYDALRMAGDEGLGWSKIEDAVGSKSSTNRALKELGKRNLFEKRNGRYYVKDVEPENPIHMSNSQGSARFHKGSAEQNGTDESGGGSGGSTTLRGGTVEPDVEPDTAKNDVVHI